MRWHCLRSGLGRTTVAARGSPQGSVLCLRWRRWLWPSLRSGRRGDCRGHGPGMRPPLSRRCRLFCRPTAPRHTCAAVPLLSRWPWSVPHTPPPCCGWGGCGRRCCPAAETPGSCSADAWKGMRTPDGQSRAGSRCATPAWGRGSVRARSACRWWACPMTFCS